MRVLVNASTLNVGGGVQVGVSFVQYTINNPSQDFDFFYIVSDAIYDSLMLTGIRDDRIVRVPDSPARLFKGCSSRRKIKSIEQSFLPDVVYSIGFPSYIKFKAKEVGRYTNPWEINIGYLPWRLIKGWGQRSVFKLSLLYRQFWAKRAYLIETQTFSAKNGIIKRLGFDENKIVVVPNTVNPVFLEENTCSNAILGLSENLIFCLSAPYPHKNLDLIPFVVSHLKYDFKCKVNFILTLPEDSHIWSSIRIDAINLGVLDCIQNVGVLSLSECVEEYKRAKLVFLPTLLEVFSATYIESIVMNKPIVTTDLDFAHDVCGDCALYFMRSDPMDAAKKIYDLLVNKSLYEKIVQCTINKSNELPTLDEKYNMIFDVLKNVSDGKYD